MGSRLRNSTRASPRRSAFRHGASTAGAASSRRRQHAAPRAGIPLQIRDVIEQERRRLRHASAVLSCLKIAAMYREWHEEFDAGDVALIVQGLIDEVIDRLDLIEQARRTRDPKVSEVPSLKPP